MDIRAALKELCEAFNAHDLDRVMTYFSDDCVLEMPRGSGPWGSRFEGNPLAERDHELEQQIISADKVQPAPGLRAERLRRAVE